MNPILVLSTADSPELARNLGVALVESGEAACVNIIPAVRSIYKWKEKLCDDTELLLVIKSSSERFEAIRSRIIAMHSYEVPEIVALSISKGDTRYLEWLEAMVVPV